MAQLNNAKIHFFHKLGDYLNKLSDKASTQAQEFDRKAMPEFNAVAIPGLPAGAPVEAYKDLIITLPYLNMFLTPQGKYPVSKSEETFYVSVSLTKMPLVIGNFIIPDKEPPLQEKQFGMSKNITLKSDTYALQEISSSMDGAYLDRVEEKSLFNLEEIVFKPLFGKPMKNSSVVFLKNNGIFLYKSIDRLTEELKHPNLISSEHINSRVHMSLIDALKNINDNVFKYNTVKALDLNTNIISDYKASKK